MKITLTGDQYGQLMAHLFPPDGCEAVAIALCGRLSTNKVHRLVVRRIELIPYEQCSVRLPDQVTWPTSFLVPLLEEARKKGWAIVKIHGHKSYRQFSSIDDISDRALFPSIYAWVENDQPHASLICMEDGDVLGRVVRQDGSFEPIPSVNIVGDDLVFHNIASNKSLTPEFGRRVVQTFGDGTYERLRKLRIAIVGCSGTGSPVIEQLARNCVGSLLLIDPDRVEEKNLNRILNSTIDHARSSALKVDVAKSAVLAMGLGTIVDAIAEDIFSPSVVKEIAECDVIFGCVDSIDGRFLLNKLATFYSIPYFDLGVKIEADGLGGVDQVVGSVHYLKPGGSSLVSRNVFTMEQVRVAGLQRTDPENYKRQLKEGYIKGVQVDRPAVIHLNSLIASLAVNELLARLHPFRIDPNADFAVNRVSLSHAIFDHEGDGEPCQSISRHVGRGDVEPLLDWTELSAKEI